MTDRHHILGAFERALNQIKANAKTMADGAEANLRNAIQGLLQRNESLCNQAIADDEAIDLLEKKIDHDGMETIMKYSPVATDLRLVISTMKMTNSLERVSDYAASIAKRARRLIKNEPLEEFKLIGELHTRMEKLFKDATTAFIDSNLELALQINQRDEELTKLQTDALHTITLSMETHPMRIPDYLDLISIIRFLKRTGDQACNISEDAVYFITAYDIRHGGERPQV